MFRVKAVHLRLTWDEVDGAIDYTIFQAEKSSGGLTNVITFTNSTWILLRIQIYLQSQASLPVHQGIVPTM